MNHTISFREYFLKYRKIILLSYLFSCFFAHGYALSNSVASNDAMGIIAGSAGTGTASGRWFLDIIVSSCKFLFTDIYFLPWLDLLLGFFLIACAAFLLLHLFQVKSKIIVAMVTCLMIVFPPVTAIALYGFTFHFDMLSLFLAVCAAVLCLRETLFSGMAAAVLMALSLGIYQAYLPFACAILVLYWIKKLVNGDSCKAVILSVVRCAATFLGGLALYFILTKFFCYIFHTPLGSYKGINHMGSIFSPRKILFSVAYSYMGVFRFLFRKTYGMTATNLAHIACIIYYAAIFVTVINLYGKIKKDAAHISLLSALLLFLPVASHSIIFMVGGDKEVIYTPMLYGVIAIFLFLPFFCRETNVLTKKYVAPFSMGFLIFVWLWTANIVYTANHRVVEQNIAVWNRIITTIESLEGYTDQTPVCLIGERPEITSALDVYQNFELIAGMRYVGGWAIPNFCKNYLGWEKTFIDFDDLPFTLPLEEIPIYPNEGSIRLVNAVVIIRVSESDESDS